MSKKQQNIAAQELKKRLKRLGVKQNFQVSQEVGNDTITMWVYNGKFFDDENSLIIWFDDYFYDVTRLTYDEGTTILENPTDEELAEYIMKHWG
ncbi:hypothetical protein [Sulfurospirillum sp. hDNRA2]|uniref:hypothetical protein n=1 Tax=Sulfurospirillum sp. hDNRA2 TaxID=3237298 RepID=UPI0020B711E1|nr:hypothetical protein [Sulfurospirillum sp. DNRA8]MCP3653256.1 hypothetical protein [Sulfurospirillum sp. DNRA8]MCR1812108.1 hypothetical protein [Sulfurospirillum sp. DNRA8]